MADHQITIKLEQQDWDRLQKLSERNGEPVESLAARFLAADLAKIFNKPPDVEPSDKIKQLSGLYRNNTELTPFEERYLTDAYSKNAD